MDKGLASSQFPILGQFLRIKHKVRVTTLVKSLSILFLGTVVAVKLVKPDILRPHAFRLAHMPFTH